MGYGYIGGIRYFHLVLLRESAVFHVYIINPYSKITLITIGVSRYISYIFFFFHDIPLFIFYSGSLHTKNSLYDINITALYHNLI